MTIKRCYPVLVGASVGENQLFYERATQTKNGITLTNNGDGSYTLNGTSTDRVQYTGSVGAMSVGTNHKILMLANGVSGTCDKKFAMFFYFQYDGGRDYPALNVFVNGALNKTALIYNTYKSGTISASGIILDIETTGTVCTNLKITPQVIDLTQMLGSSIADRAYTLEQQTAGSGLAWLRSYGFLGGYVPYNSGSLESVEVTEKVVTGKNQCSGMLYDGKVPSIASGALVSYHGIRSDFIHVIPNTVYTATFPYSVLNAFVEYDASKTFLKATLNANAFTTAPNTAYVMLRSDLPSGTDEAKDCMFELGSTTTDYEPYTSTTYSLGSDVLGGIFKLSDGAIYADGDRKEADGTITRRYKMIDLGTLAFNDSNPSSHIFRAVLNDAKMSSDVQSQQNAPVNALMSNGYQVMGFTPISPNDDKRFAIGFRANGDKRLAIIAHDYDSVSAFTQAISGVYLVYELQTPTTEQSSPFTSPQICYPDGTEEFVTENGVPVGHETKYQL